MIKCSSDFASLVKADKAPIGMVMFGAISIALGMIAYLGKFGKIPACLGNRESILGVTIGTPLVLAIALAYYRCQCRNVTLSTPEESLESPEANQNTDNLLFLTLLNTSLQIRLNPILLYLKDLLVIASHFRNLSLTCKLGNKIFEVFLTQVVSLDLSSTRYMDSHLARALPVHVFLRFSPTQDIQIKMEKFKSSLQVLHLETDAQIDNPATFFGPMTSLTVLSIFFQRVKGLCSHLPQSLTELHLVENVVTPSGFTHLTKLRSLNHSFSRVTDVGVLPSSLRKLALSNNSKIKRMEAFSLMTALEYLLF